MIERRTAVAHLRAVARICHFLWASASSAATHRPWVHEEPSLAILNGCVCAPPE